MRTVTLEFDEQEYQAIYDTASNNGYDSVEEYLKEIVMESLDDEYFIDDEEIDDGVYADSEDDE